MKNRQIGGNSANSADKLWRIILESFQAKAIMFAVLFSVISLYGTTNYVSSTSGDDANTGADWDNAWLSLTNAVTQSASGDTVILSNGVYTLGSQLTIDKALTVIGFGDDPEDVAITPETATRIDLLKLTHADALVENLTVRDGRYGIHLSGAGTVRGCIIRHCGHHRDYTAVYLDGGGLVENSVIRDCVGGNAGGGVRINGAGTLRNSLVADNLCTIGNNIGGGVYIGGSGGLIENCTIVRNEAGNQAGGVYSLGSAGTIRNSIVMFNRSPQGMNLDGNPVVDSSTILSPVHTRTGTTRDIDPQFVDFENGDYRLRPGSPAIDTGVDEAWMSDATDLDGNPRLDGIVDVGAYEYTRGTLEAGFQPAPRSGFQDVTEIVFTGAAEGLNTNGLSFSWDFENDGTPDIEGLDLAVVTNVYSTSGHKTVKLTITNNFSETAVHIFTNAVKIGPATVYVAQGANSDTYPYASWSAAASNLQDAVDAAVPGSVVQVGKGNYLLTETLLIRDDIVLESVSGAADTIVDGQNSVGCIRMDPWEDRLSGYLAAVVDGLTIRNGLDNPGGVGMPYGGTLRNSVVSNNVGTGLTGLGGLLVSSSGSLVENCWIIYNKGQRHGAGAGKLQLGGVLRNSIVYGNSTGGGSGPGAGAFSFNRGGLIENCTIVGNYSPNNTGTGGIYASVSGTVRNSIVYFNLGDGTSGVNDIKSGSWSSTSTDNITSVLVANVSGSTADPDFVKDGSGYGETHVPGNYRLQPNSPAIDEGSFQTWMTGAFDLDGKPRIYGSSVDIGCYEWHPPAGTLIIIQ